MNLSRRKNNIWVYIIVTVLASFSFFPIMWMISTSFKKQGDIFTMPPQFIPNSPTLVNFKEIFTSKTFLIYYRNSIIVAACTTILCLIIAILAGYSFSRFRFKGSMFIQIFVLVAQMFPLVMMLLSIYVIFFKLHLTNTLYALILGDCTFALPFSIWMLKGFFDTIPKDIEEAAKLDGCSRIGILSKIIIPLLTPGIISTAIYAFLLSWDDYLFAMTLTSSSNMRTLPVGITLTYLGEFAYKWGPLMAASCATTLPIVIVFMILQRYFVKGLTMGSVKG